MALSATSHSALHWSHQSSYWQLVTEYNKREGCVSKRLVLMKFESYMTSMCHTILSLNLFQSFEKVKKDILNSWWENEFGLRAVIDQRLLQVKMRESIPSIERNV